MDSLKSNEFYQKIEKKMISDKESEQKVKERESITSSNKNQRRK